MQGPTVKRGTAVRGRPLTRPLVVGGAALAGLGVLALRDPHNAGSYGHCPMLTLTGWYCPLCGALRGTYELVHGNLSAAWSMNALWVVLIPLVVATWAVWLIARKRGHSLPQWLTSTRAVIAVFVVLAAFGLLRNIGPLAAVLAPH